MPVRIVSWNVNGLRSCLEKGFLRWLAADKPDIVCLQEVRTGLQQLETLEPQFEGYKCFWHPAEKKGYSGTAILTRYEPVAVHRGLCGGEDVQGRAITADFGTFKVASLYGPNSSVENGKLPMKQFWLRNLAEHATAHSDVPLVLCGDLNVALTSLDSQGVPHPPGYNGCTDEERAGMQALMLDCDLADPAREAAGDTLLSSWWSPYEFGRKPGNGIRLDYALVTAAHRDLVRGGRVHPEVLGSDHCPVSVEVEVPVAHLRHAAVLATQKQLL